MRGTTMSITALAMLLALAARAVAQPAPPMSSPPVTTGDCAALAGLRIEDTNLLSATQVPAGGDLPAYCRVLGYVRPAINFEVRLPVADWNGKSGCRIIAPRRSYSSHLRRPWRTSFFLFYNAISAREPRPRLGLVRAS